MRHWLDATAMALLALALSGGAFAAPFSLVEFLEGKAAAAQLTQAERDEAVKGYLPADAVDFHELLGQPPTSGSSRDKADVTEHRAERLAPKARWKLAVADDASVYDRFQDALGVTLDRKHLPHLIRLLNRVERDMWDPTGGAKDYFHRQRPYQRFKFTRICGEASAKPQSYPSGHASLSWAAVLVLSDVAHAKAEDLLARGLEYSESRVVCGVHFPSDVEAGRLLATAIVAHEYAMPDFTRDLACAKAEYEAVAKGETPHLDAACQ